MQNAGYDQSQDDFEVEISDIPAADGAADGPVPGKVTLLSRKPRYSQRQRTLQSMLTGGVVLLALLAMIGSYGPTRSIVTSSLSSLIPSPAPTLAPGANLFYVEKTLAWSKVSLDGHLLTHLPAIDVDPPLQLTQGHHRLLWEAEPFEPLACSLSVPVEGGDTCVVEDLAAAPSGGYVPVISFTPTLDTLPPAQRDRLVSAAQKALDGLKSSETVQPGERFFDPEPVSLFDTSTQPLRATLSFQLDTDIRYRLPCKLRLIGKPCNVKDCRLFCTMLVQSPSTAEKSWDVYANIRSFWEYAAPGGKVVEQDQPDVLFAHIISLHITWDGTDWHVTVPMAVTAESLVCTLARDKIGLNTTYRLAVGVAGAAVRWFATSAPNPAAGCLMAAVLAQNIGLPSAPVALCLYRFGMLVAANNVARMYWPLMLPATAYERSLAEQIAALPNSQPAFLHVQGPAA